MTRTLLTQAFGRDNVDLYEDVLKCSKDASSSQLRKAYYTQAKIFHPDKNTGDDKATIKFQAISFAYNYLKDAERRKDYDQDGILPEENDMDADDDNKTNQDWKKYFDMIFGKVMSTKEIDDFEMKYKMSDEEEKDVLKYYEKCKGDMVKCLEFVMLSQERDVERWIEDYIQPAIDAGTIHNYDKQLEKSRNQISKRLEKEQGIDDDETETEESDQEENKKPKKKIKESTKQKAKRAKPTKAKKPKKSSAPSQDLIAAIHNKRGGGGGDPFSALGARYGVDMSGDDPLDDAAFEKIQSKWKK